MISSSVTAVNDTLIGSAGNDVLLGGLGDDDILLDEDQFAVAKIRLADLLAGSMHR